MNYQIYINLCSTVLFNTKDIDVALWKELFPNYKRGFVFLLSYFNITCVEIG